MAVWGGRQRAAGLSCCTLSRKALASAMLHEAWTIAMFCRAGADLAHHPATTGEFAPKVVLLRRMGDLAFCRSGSLLFAAKLGSGLRALACTEWVHGCVVGLNR